MKTILLYGIGPFPSQDNPVCTAGGLRTMQFLSVLQDSHRVKLFLIGGDNDEGTFVNERTYEISRQSPLLHKKAKEVFQKCKYDAVLGVNTFPSYIAATSIQNTVPFWADLNGWIMAEVQAQAYEVDHNHFLANGWEQEKTILLRADHISTVSNPQRYATIGELASLGRLTKECFAQNLVDVIPNIPQEVLPVCSDETLFRGKGIPADAFVVAQIGGFNNWVDEKTLFEALEKAMEQDEMVYFVTTGGSISGIADNTFARFQKRVEKSRFKSRFVFLGWIDTKCIPNVYRNSDLGIMTDVMCLETETGARNRLNEMMAYGLPFITTKGSEITRDIEENECGRVVESGDKNAIAEAIISLRKDKNERLRISNNSLSFCKKNLKPELILSPLIQWLNSEKIQLTHGTRVKYSSSNPLSKITPGVQYLRDRGVKQFWKKLRQRKRK